MAVHFHRPSTVTNITQAQLQASGGREVFLQAFLPPLSHLYDKQEMKTPFLHICEVVFFKNVTSFKLACSMLENA